MTNKTFFGETLFPKDKEDRLASFQYKGSDTSLLYRFFYGKIAELLVNNVIPETVA